MWQQLCCRCCEIYVHLWPPNHASTVAMHIAPQVPVYARVYVCVCVCLHATDSPLDTRVCKCSNIQVIVPAIRKSSLIWHLSHLSFFFEIRNKMFIMLPEFFAPPSPSLPLGGAHKSATAFHFPAHLAAQFQPRSQIGQNTKQKKNDEAKKGKSLPRQNVSEAAALNSFPP